MSWIHRGDWLALLRWTITNESASGPINATAPTPVTNAEFSKQLGRVLGRPSLLPAPAFALRLLLGEMADPLLLASQRVLPARAESLAFQFSYPQLGPALEALFGRRG
jgi:NAD dependent epimerase/dehydratase family enzyme